jgi:hypothetical protein
MRKLYSTKKLSLAKTFVSLTLSLFLIGIVSVPAAPVYAEEASYYNNLACYNANGYSASRVIADAARWYNLNPQVILATLQKEQSLVTTPTLNQYGLDWAMGYAVPDSGNRDYSKQGFAVQVDWGAWQLRWNMDMSNTNTAKVSPYFVGNTFQIDGVNVTPATSATASLYRYTPHFHGNQNFETIINNWWPGTANATWDNNNIISDASFGNAGTMTQQQIQDFLVAQGSYLANYTVPNDVIIGPESYKCPVPNITTVYRFYNVQNNSHFYTASMLEKDYVISKWPNIYHYEGVAYSFNASNPDNNVPLYRFYNKQNGSHFYTSSELEKNYVNSHWSNIYNLEGVAYNVSTNPNGGTPVYRFYNKTNGTHFYTSSELEKNNVIAKWPNIYNFEGAGFYLAN